MSEPVIIRREPGTAFEDSMLLGNGHMGIAIAGAPQDQILQLSHNTFFSGETPRTPSREGSPEAFRLARQAAENGDDDALREAIKGCMGIRENYGTNLPVGRLHLKLHLPRTAFYERRLDLAQGLWRCRFEDGENFYEEEAFCSHPDKAFVLTIKTDCPQGIRADLWLEGYDAPLFSDASDQKLCFSTQALETRHSDGTCGTKLEGCLTVSALGGRVLAQNESLQIVRAKSLTMVLAMETDYRTDPEESAFDARQLRTLTLSRAEDVLKNPDAVRMRHIQDFSEKMRRCSLSLGGEDREEDAVDLLKKSRETGDRRRLTELQFALGRYLLCSSSREDSAVPAPLQGVWNDNVACRIGWTCDMHLDINTQMNYWIAGPGNLSECRLPVFSWMKYRLVPQGRRAAQGCYGLPGWSAEVVSNAWGFAAPYWDVPLAPCPTGGIWEASDLYEYWKTTKDRTFLQNTAWPILCEAVDFFAAYLFTDNDGSLSCGPSVSPENSFLRNGARVYAANGCTYEKLMIAELFKEYLDLYEELQADLSSEEAARAEHVRDLLNHLDVYRIALDGTLAEWPVDLPAADPQHRHTSHLLGLFPYDQITPEDTPALADAARRSIQSRLTPPEGFEDTGWARSLLLLYADRLQDEKSAAVHLADFQDMLTEKNLLIMHPATRGTATDHPVYELDGNTGFSMGVSEMLVSQTRGRIRLLPALPAQFAHGRFSGVSLYNKNTLTFSWENGIPTHIELDAKEANSVLLCFKKQQKKILLHPGKNSFDHLFAVD